MTTFTIELEPDAADLVTRAAAETGTRVEEYIAAAAERFVLDQEAFAELPPTQEEVAAIEEGLADIAAGRTHSHEEVMAELRARFRR